MLASRWLRVVESPSDLDVQTERGGVLPCCGIHPLADVRGVNSSVTLVFVVLDS